MTRTADRTLIQTLGFADPDKKEPKHDLACQYLADPKVGLALWQRLAATDTRYSPLPNNPDFYWMRRDAAFWDDDNVEHRHGWMFHGPWVATSCAASMEVVISKGEGKYRSHIGFVDVVLKAGFTRWEILGERGPSGGIYDRLLDGDWNEICATFKSGGKAGLAELADTEPAPFYGPHPRWGQERQLKMWIDDSEGRESRSAIVEVKTHPVSIGDILRQIKLYDDYFRHEGAGCPPILATTYDMLEGDVAALKSERITHVQLGEKFAAWCETRKTAKASSLEV